MKEIHSKTCIAALIILLFIIACKKNNPAKPDIQPYNTILRAMAGQDITLILPANYCTLYGSVSYTRSSIKSYVWEKKSGPPSYSIETPDSVITKVSNLEKGIYEFELTITDQMGLIAKDTVIVTVQKLFVNPTANAGGDIWLITPSNSCTLYGSASSGSSSIKGYEWKKISGPASYSIESPDSLRAKVGNLEIGVYEFELTVTNQESLTAKDTAIVTVRELSASPTEIILNNLSWIFPWYPSIQIKNFNHLIPQGNVFKIFIKRDNNTQWVEVPLFSPSSTSMLVKYEYFVETRPDGAGMYIYGSLYIFYYGMDTKDTPSVKIIY